MGELSVVNGATLKCTGCAGMSSFLLVFPQVKVRVDGGNAANINDHKPVNVLPFGPCTFKSNTPCVPVTPSPWLLGQGSTSLGGPPILQKISRLECKMGGVITIEDSGQAAPFSACDASPAASAFREFLGDLDDRMQMEEAAAAAAAQAKYDNSIPGMLKNTGRAILTDPLAGAKEYIAAEHQSTFGQAYAGLLDGLVRHPLLPFAAVDGMYHAKSPAEFMLNLVSLVPAAKPLQLVNAGIKGLQKAKMFRAFRRAPKPGRTTIVGPVLPKAAAIRVAVELARSRRLTQARAAKNAAAKARRSRPAIVRPAPPAGPGPRKKPAWLQRIEAGNRFNREQRPNYPNNELYINNPKGGYTVLDSYNPGTGEIVSRKLTQLGEVQEITAIRYVNELADKYPPGRTIANVPSSGALAGQRLDGQMILEVPPQTKPIPQAVLDAAENAGILIRDTAGRTY